MIHSFVKGGKKQKITAEVRNIAASFFIADTPGTLMTLMRPLLFMTYSRSCTSAPGKLLSEVQRYQIKKEGDLSSPLCLVGGERTQCVCVCVCFHTTCEGGRCCSDTLAHVNKCGKAHNVPAVPRAAEECTANGECTVVRWQEVALAPVRGLTLH